MRCVLNRQSFEIPSSFREITSLRSIRLNYANMRIVEQGLSKSISLEGKNPKSR